MSGKQQSDTRDIWKELILNEDRLKAERANLFLVVNAILVGAYAVTSTPFHWLRILVCCAGLLFAFCWWYLAQRGLKNANFYWEKIQETESNLPESEKVFSLIRKERDHYPWYLRISSNKIHSWFLPMLWIIVWIVILSYEV
jgi:hypothetical protein